VLPEAAIETARMIAGKYNAGFVILDKARQIARVVFPQATVDFALQEGNCLEADLHRRDFTINAIAYNLHQETLIDPLNGVKDLEKGLLKMITAENLADDPLRLLRGYRQAAQLGFKIDLPTRLTICELSPLLGQVAAERVQSELSYLLANPQGNDWLLAAWQDGLLKPWFKQTTLAKVQHAIQVEQEIADLKVTLSPEQYQHFLQTLDKKGVQTAKLASLVSSVLEIAELELENLKYSRQESRAVIAILKTLAHLAQPDLILNLRAQYFLFLEVGKHFPILVLFALANQFDASKIHFLLDRYLDPRDRVAHPQPLIKGNDLIEALNLKPSPLIGKLLTEIQVAQIENKINTPEEALIFAEFLVKSDQLKALDKIVLIPN
jgi:tRNA nucleotidyltransferase (CCA-adding enzyme)